MAPMMSTLRKAAVLAVATPASAVTILRYPDADTDCSEDANVISMLDFADSTNFNIQSGLSVNGDGAHAATTLHLAVDGTSFGWKLPACTDDSGTVLAPTFHKADGSAVLADDGTTTPALAAATVVLKKYLTIADGATYASPNVCYTKDGKNYKVSCGGTATAQTLAGITLRVFKQVADSDSAGCTAANEIIQADNLEADKLDTKLGLGATKDLNSCLTSTLSIDSADASVYYKMDCTATDAAATIAYYTDNTCGTVDADSNNKKRDAMRLAMKADGVYPTNGVCIKPSGSTTHYKLDCNGVQKTADGYVTTAAPASTTTSGSVAATVSAVAVTAGLWML